MKAIATITALLAAVCAVSGCSGIYAADVYSRAVDPYTPVNEEDVRFGECTISFDDGVSVAGQGAWYKDGNIVISEGGVYKITGSFDSGCINIDTPDPVKLIFSNAVITSPDGSAVISDSDKLIIASDGVNTITGSSGNSAVTTSGSLLIAGIGSMDIGGIISRGGIRFSRDVSTACEIIRTDDGDLISGTLCVR
ncbi:MAG: carbohydrate-binding domain-containing protein [Ruminiclostridium sp.]|nr:carbohydrate-binding domain-containing protein [Ruminiclostridium sp.]